jgi:hypothetical protein
MIFIANYKTTKVLEPSKETFHLPSFFISSQDATILCRGLTTIALMWRYHLYATLLGQTSIQRITVIRQIASYLFRHVLQKTGIKSIVNKSYFMRPGTCCANGDRKTESVRKAHNFGSFAPFGFAHTIAPFFAGAKVPSIKPSLKSMPPRFFKSWASAVSILAKTPELFQCWKYRWQVLFGGYRSGRSDHWAPVRRIQRMPFNISLGFCGGLPDFPGSALGFGMNFAIRCHCSFVMSISHISAHINSKVEVLG